MHELSIVMSIIDIAQRYAKKENATAIEEIEIDIGCLSTIQLEAFEFAWKHAVKETVLKKTRKNIHHIQGKAVCLTCNTLFAIDNLFEVCPACGEHNFDIKEGKELRVRSLIIV